MEEQDQESSVRDGRRSSSKGEACEELRQYMYCIFSNVCFAGYNIVSKVALDKGMNRYVLVAYGQIFGTLATAFFAFIFERNNNSKLSVAILRNVFFLGLLGTVLSRTLFLAGLEYTTPTFASALVNLIPSITFILAVLCRMEKLEISKRGSQAKILGTIIAFGGATLMTLYKGPAVISFHSQRSNQPTTGARLLLGKDLIKGSLILVVSFISLSAFYILQTITIKMYQAPITLTSLTCLSGAILSTIMTEILDHKASSWKLSWNITLLAPIYSGIVIFGITIYVQTLVVRKKGPVFMTAFRPLATIIVAIMGLLILGDALYMGSIIGASLIVLGLYATLWGKEKEKAEKLSQQTVSEEVIEIKEAKQ
ncbi:WAT1-related protein At5g07050-like isoform X1 [Juglans microcarpa x Juglans regia]|uniref:WAT1-related protein At5g07050-like isoform X1 n=2 Tax=Juglans microcarpa x Juglans regia TaxID=2249226 RepID=UPI001B7EC832|nr:WAT1-related protein At5g07050-like isoform X1 [Juglans microcarpa x Juglans regia]